MADASQSDPRASTVDPRSGYVTDVLYPRSFAPQIAPTTLRLVAALNGHAAPPEDDFDYCDLGCATGDTLTTLAAANPGARFVGVEANPEHVAKGRARAARGGVSNVEMLELDFEQLGASGRPLPRFDFIVAHGVWSWVSPRKRDAILAFVRSSLKPGGLFYLGYNALPGWADVAPLRRLMLEASAGGSQASTLERARAGVELLSRLSDSGAAYFSSHPVAKSMLALMKTGGLPYVAHEYFHADWEPMYFADVARTLATSGLSFLGRLPLHANVRELAIPPSLRKTADGFPDRVALEGLLDYAGNELFRSDVFAKGSVVRAVDETRYYFEGTSFGTLTALAHVKREVRLPFYTLEYKTPIYDAILDVVAKRAATAMELAQRPELAQLGQLRIGDCLQNLALGGQVVPMLPRVSAAAPGPAARYRLAGRYNALVLEEALAQEGPLVLASPATRGGVHVSLLEALALQLVTDPALSPEGYGDRLRAYARSRPMPLSIGDRKIKDEAELVRVMAREVDRFRSGGLPKLWEAGVVDVEG